MLKKNILECIGDTDLVYLPHISKKFFNNIYFKKENTNPFGSAKDRIMKKIIEENLKKGTITNQSTIIEATSGNTGIGLAGICLYYKLKLIIILPKGTSKERIKLLKLYQAKLIFTPRKKGIKYAQELAEKLSRSNPHYFYPSQFTNKLNYIAQYTTGEEIFSVLPNINYIVCGIGTGGMIQGLSNYISSHQLKTKLIAIEPYAFPTINKKVKQKNKIEGLGAGFIPPILNPTIIDQCLMIKNNEAYEGVKDLLKNEAYFGGISTGACYVGVIKLIDNLKLKNQNIVFISVDDGMKYLSRFKG